MLLGQGREQGDLIIGQVCLFAEVLGQGAVPFRLPGVEGGRELRVGQEFQLRGQQTEEQVMIGGRDRHGRSPQGP